jgi:hypothetical protein
MPIWASVGAMFEALSAKMSSLTGDRPPGSRSIWR